MEINIIPTSQAEYIGKSLAKRSLKVIFSEKNREGKRYFPDGEVYVKISKVGKIKGRTIVLHSGAPNPNDGLIELEMILEILKKSKARTIEIFFTYFPYGRQDKIFEKGETRAAENLIRKLIGYYGVSKIYVIDAHFWGREWVKRYPIINVSAVDLLIQSALRDFPEAIFLPADIGAEQRTGLKLKGLEKKRIDSYLVKIKSNEEFKEIVKGKVVGVIDDIVATGTTLISFYEECEKYGAKEVLALITHGVLLEGIKRIKSKYSRIYLTNTINRKEANVDITDLIFKTIYLPKIF
jgi:ribose-phosphate pyrophosphokinase